MIEPVQYAAALLLIAVFGLWFAWCIWFIVVAIKMAFRRDRERAMVQVGLLLVLIGAGWLSLDLFLLPPLALAFAFWLRLPEGFNSIFYFVEISMSLCCLGYGVSILFRSYRKAHHAGSSVKAATQA